MFSLFTENMGCNTIWLAAVAVIGVMMLTFCGVISEFQNHLKGVRTDLNLLTNAVLGEKPKVGRTRIRLTSLHDNE